MWIILTILLAITCMWLIKVNKDLANRNEYLIRQEGDNKSRLHKLMMDTENKVMVFRFDTSSISGDEVRQLSDNVRDLRGKGYHILVMDNSFDFSEIKLCEKEDEKLKRVLEDKEDSE